MASRSSWFLAISLSLMWVTGCQSTSPVATPSRDLSRIDPSPLPSSAQLSSLTAATFRAFQSSTDLRSELTAPIQDEAQRLVIVSWTNGAAPAASAPGVGNGVTEAVNDAMRSLRPEVVARLTWGVSIDVVERLDTVGDVKSLRLDRKGDGLIFADRGQVMLPAQLRARALVSESGRYTPPTLDRLLSRPSHRISGVTFATNGADVVQLRHGRPLVEDDDLTDEALAQSLSYAEQYLRSIVDQEGRFLYQLDTATGRLDSDYNLARHAGTLAALVDLFAESRDSKTLEAIDRAIGFLNSVHKEVEFLPGTDGPRVAVWSGQVRLAAVSLSLLALSRYIEVTGDPTHIDLASDIGHYCQLLQHADGRYAPHNRSFTSGADLGGVSPYAPGETDLALCLLADVTQAQTWLDTAENNIRYLVEVRDRDVDQEPHDHWLLYALNALDSRRPHSRNVEKAKKVVVAILDTQDLNPESGAEVGGWKSRGGARVTPAATRAEGLLAATQLFRRRGEEEWERRSAEGARRAIAFLLRTQIVPETSHHLRVPHSFVGAFPARMDRDEVRIDFVQHAVAAILAYREWRNRSPSR